MKPHVIIVDEIKEAYRMSDMSQCRIILPCESFIYNEILIIFVCFMSTAGIPTCHLRRFIVLLVMR